MRLIASFGLLALAVLPACNMVAFTANTTSKVLRVASPALNQESDYDLAKAAAPASLKTIEGFHLATPDNEILIGILARGYCEYTFGFIEMDLLKARAAGDDETEQHLTKRATGLYLRCMNYGLKLLGSSWEKAIHSDEKTWEAKVKGADKDDVVGLYFTALGLASSINLNRDNIEMVAYANKAKVVFDRVTQLDPNFYNGGAYMALGMLYSSRPHALGGNPEKGKELFEKASSITGGKFLMPKVLMGYAVGRITNDREFFHKTLVQVLETSPAIFPEGRLANEIAHLRAKFYLAHEKEYF
jgi:hypothetical protein